MQASGACEGKATLAICHRSEKDLLRSPPPALIYNSDIVGNAFGCCKSLARRSSFRRCSFEAVGPVSPVAFHFPRIQQGDARWITSAAATGLFVHLGKYVKYFNQAPHSSASSTLDAERAEILNALDAGPQFVAVEGLSEDYDQWKLQVVDQRGTLAQYMLRRLQDPSSVQIKRRE